MNNPPIPIAAIPPVQHIKHAHPAKRVAQQAHIPALDTPVLLLLLFLLLLLLLLL